MQSALERWQEILDARAQQMDAAYARLGHSSANYWDRRAQGFHRATKDTISSDPLYLRLHKVVDAQISVLDVGAGTGRFALALAPQARQVIAVEPNARMLHYLQQGASERGITNITTISSTWEAAPDDLQADIVLCSHVLYPIRAIDTFLAKLHSATLREAYLYVRATHFDALTAHIWRHFHGDERHLPPGYIHVLDVMYEMGLYADVEVLKLPQSLRFPSLDTAVDELLEQLILPNDEPTRHELRALLEAWLIERDGAFTPPQESMICAIIRFNK
jgi:SAM-dependent methyltransferase